MIANLFKKFISHLLNYYISLFSLTKKYGEILNLCNKALQWDPKNHMALFNKSLIFLKLDKYNEALECCENLLNLKPRKGIHNPTIIAKCIILLLLKRYNKLIEVCDQALMYVKGKNVKILLNFKGTALYELEEYAGALACFDSVIAWDKNGNYAKLAWTMKGYTLHLLGDFDKAIKCYDISLKKPYKIIAEYTWLYKSEALKEREKYYEALECCEKALKLNIGEELYWASKGSVYASLKDYNKALKCYDTSSKLDPKNKYTWLNKGNVLIHLNNPEDALKCYNKALKIDPGYDNARYNMQKIITENKENQTQKLKWDTLKNTEPTKPHININPHILINALVTIILIAALALLTFAILDVTFDLMLSETLFNIL